MSEARAKLDQAITQVAERFPGELGFAAMNVGTGETVTWRADTMMPTASAIKAPILAELYRQVEAGQLSLETRVPVAPDDIIAGSGVLRRMAPGLQPTVHDLAVLMIIVSDNTATNMLIDLLGGPGRINATLHDRLGLRQTTLHNRIDFAAIGDDIRRFAECSPRDLMTYMAMLGRGEVISPAASAAIIDILRQQQYLDRFPRYLKIEPYASEGTPVALWAGGKTGSFSADRIDSGLVGFADGTLIAHATMTANGADPAYWPENDAVIAIGLLGRLVVEYWWPETAGPAPLHASLNSELWLTGAP